MTDEIMAYEPRKLQNPGVIEAFGAAVMAVGVRRVAGKLRKAESTLYGEMNPDGDQKKFKLGVDDAIEATLIMRGLGHLDCSLPAGDSEASA